MRRVTHVYGMGFEPASTSPAIAPIPIVYERVNEPPRWEYHTVAIDSREDEPLDERALNALGAEGWTLVNVIQVEPARLIYYFLRPA